MWKKLEAWFKKLFGKAPNVLQTVSNDIRLIAPAVAGLLAIEDPELAPVVLPIANEVAGDLTLAATIIEHEQKTPGTSAFKTIGNIFDVIAENLKSLLVAGHIKNETLKAEITAAVEEVATMKGLLTQGASGTPKPASAQ